MESTAKTIMRLRVEKGLSKADISRACGLTQTAYTNIEDEKTKSISIEIGKKIATSLGVSFSELFNIPGDSQKIDSLNKEIQILQTRIKEKDLLNNLIKIVLTKAILEERMDVNLFLVELLQRDSNTPEVRELIYHMRDVLYDSFKNRMKFIISSGIMPKEELAGAFDGRIIPPDLFEE